VKRGPGGPRPKPVKRPATRRRPNVIQSITDTLPMIVTGPFTPLNKESVFSEIINYDVTSGNTPDFQAQSRRPYDLTYEPSYSRLINAGTVIFTNARMYQLC
jgi:hypothetical protein